MPMGDETWSRRATMPSKKSKTAPRMTKAKASVVSPVKAKDVAMQPEIRLQHVILLGICFLKFIVILSTWR